MKFSQAQTTITLTEEDVKQALELYINKKSNKVHRISTVTRKTRTEASGFGTMESFIEYPDGMVVVAAVM